MTATSSKYAVIQAGGHQYRVDEGGKVTVDFIAGKVGETVQFKNVLMVGGAQPSFGSPLVSGAMVEATIAEQRRLPKILVFKTKRRKNYKRTQGHRQAVTVIEINKIKA